jgi:NADPH:quinone reductase-like Zn-dependent oxidoreductase
MKAALIYAPGETPRYGDIDDPVPNEGQELVRVLAASLKNIDKSLAAGTHYHADTRPWPRPVGMDAVVERADGSRVYAAGTSGFMAEKAVIGRGMAVGVPAGLDSVLAAALPNPGLAAWFALNGKAQFRSGQTLLVLGATGASGRLAVHFAKEMGAARIVAAGRNPKALQELEGLGADELISLSAPEAGIREALGRTVARGHVDLVVDFVWGRPAELALDALGGHDVEAAARLTRYLQIGSMAGASINLKSTILRSAEIEIFGQGGGSVAKDLMARAPEVLAKLFERAALGRLPFNVERVRLSDVAAAWNRDSEGRRIVLVP